MKFSLLPLSRCLFICFIVTVCFYSDSSDSVICSLLLPHLLPLPFSISLNYYRSNIVIYIWMRRNGQGRRRQLQTWPSLIPPATSFELFVCHCPLAARFLSYSIWHASMVFSTVSHIDYRRRPRPCCCCCSCCCLINLWFAKALKFPSLLIRLHTITHWVRLSTTING